MQKNEIATIPYFAHEGIIAKLERANKRLFILVLVLIISLVCSNVGWIVYECQYEDVVTTTEIDAKQDGTGVNIVGAGDIDYGAESKNN